MTTATIVRSIVSAAAVARAPRLRARSSVALRETTGIDTGNRGMFRIQQQRRRQQTRPFVTTSAAAAAAAAGGGQSNLKELVVKKNEDNAVTVWSKSWCPFCNQVKALFDKMEVNYLAARGLDGERRGGIRISGSTC